MDVIFRKVRERDIDILLLEQMYCSADFINWFFLHVTKRRPARLKLLSAKHSVVGSLGQTDIEVMVVDEGGGEIVFLIENKIGRTKQPTQSERYAARCAMYSGQECRVVLVTPKRYATTSFVEGYKSVVELEDILKWFQDNELDSLRKFFKIALLEQALTPPKLGKDGDFRMQYWSTSQRDEYRVLRMPEHGRSFRFHPEGLPAHVRLVHKLVRGRVEIVFRGKRNEFLALKKAVADLPEHSFEVRTYPKASAIWVQVSPLIMDMPFDPQKQKVVEGLQAARKLWEWFCGNKDAIMGAVS
jgi:hypothetical protein